MSNNEDCLKSKGDKVCYDKFGEARKRLVEKTPNHLLHKITTSDIIDEMLETDDFPCLFSPKTVANKVSRERLRRVRLRSQKK